MANALTGEVAFTVDGEEMILLIDINALCVVEDRLGKKTADIVGDLEAMGLSMLRTIFWAGLQDHRPGLSPKEAGKIIQQITPPKARELVMQAFIASFPVPQEGDEAAEGEGP